MRQEQKTSFVDVDGDSEEFKKWNQFKENQHEQA